MGRGRAKAKQTKVARELKYFSPDTDYSALERELHQRSEVGNDDIHTAGYSSDDEDDIDDDWTPRGRR